MNYFYSISENCKNKHAKFLIVKVNNLSFQRVFDGCLCCEHWNIDCMKNNRGKHYDTYGKKGVLLFAREKKI